MLLIALAALLLIFGIVGSIAPGVMWPMTFILLGASALMLLAVLAVDAVSKTKNGIVATALVGIVLGLTSGLASVSVNMQQTCAAEAGPTGTTG